MWPRIAIWVWHWVQATGGWNQTVLKRQVKYSLAKTWWRVVLLPWRNILPQNRDQPTSFRMQAMICKMDFGKHGLFGSWLSAKVRDFVASRNMKHLETTTPGGSIQLAMINPFLYATWLLWLVTYREPFFLNGSIWVYPRLRVDRPRWTDQSIHEFILFLALIHHVLWQN
jgi:hypothetical protein